MTFVLFLNTIVMDLIASGHWLCFLSNHLLLNGGGQWRLGEIPKIYLFLLLLMDCIMSCENRVELGFNNGKIEDNGRGGKVVLGWALFGSLYEVKLQSIKWGKRIYLHTLNLLKKSSHIILTNQKCKCKSIYYLVWLSISYLIFINVENQAFSLSVTFYNFSISNKWTFGHPCS